MLLPTGAYDIEDISGAIIGQIQGITGPNKISIPDEPDKYPIEIRAHEPLLGTIIEINSPNYAVDIYNSSLRGILGYPEFAPGTVSLIIYHQSHTESILDLRNLVITDMTKTSLTNKFT